jgi:CDP-diacylglycerol--glycerol-3-phosphate 3-phosphatidyltransferase
MTWANALTFGRIALVPVFVYFMVAAGRPDPAEPATHPATYLAFAVFVAAAMTDTLDGYVARRRRQVTSLGAFLDPLADKLLVGAALVTLVILRSFPLWAALTIATREIAVSVLRVFAARQGRSIPASTSGKFKTAIQIPMVLLWLLPRVGTISVLQDVAVYAAVALTIYSGGKYFWEVRRPAESRAIAR